MTSSDDRRPTSDAADEQLAQWARAVQMVSFRGPTPPPWLLDELAEGTGSVCLFGGNIESDDAVADLVAALRQARRDVVVAVDEEGGDVTRLDHHRGSDVPGAAVLGAVDDVDATAAVHRVIGRRLVALGIDLDLAPVADVNVTAANPVIGVRSFGADAALVARHVAAAVDGLQSTGVAACLKHFPGHGATTADSHQALPVLDADAATLHDRELRPFAGTAAAAVMTAHIVVPALGDEPATRNRRILELLRTELGFGGVIVSDALDMAGVHGPHAQYGTVTPAMIGDAAVAAVAAGCDLLCLGANQGHEVPEAVTAALVDAVHDGRLDAARLADAAQRVAALPRAGTGRDPGPDDADRAVVADVAVRAVSVEGALPPTLAEALVVDCRAEASMANSDVPWGLGPAMHAAAPTVQFADAWPATSPDQLLAAAADRPLVVAVRSAGAHRWQLELLRHLAPHRPDLVVVEVGWPADLDDYPDAVLVRTYGASRASTEAAAAVLLSPH